MKKLLLALAVLVGLALPGMAQNNTENTISLAVKEGITNFMVYRDFESEDMIALKTVLDNANEGDWGTISDSVVKTVINLSMTYMRDTSFINFLIDNGMPIREYNRYIKFTREKIKESNDFGEPLVSDFAQYYMEDIKAGKAILSLFISKVVEKASLDFFRNEDYHAESMTIIKNLLKNNDNWKLISDSTISKLLTLSVPFVEFLIDDLGMPESEFNRYINIAQEKMDEFNRIFKKLSSGETDESFSIREYETCGAVLELFDQAKKEKMYKKIPKIHEQIDQILRENTQKKLERHEQQPSQQDNSLYNY